ncbi:MAG: glycosyltransferase [Cyanobacteria bacterium P01_H01_bin.58]
MASCLQHLAVILHDLEGGGMQRVTITLIQAMLQQRPHLKIDLVVASAQGDYRQQIPAEVNLIDLHASFDFRTKSLARLVPRIRRYLRDNQPPVILSCLPGLNCLTLLASFALSKKPQIILAEHTLPLAKWMAQETRDRQLPAGLLPRLTSPLMGFTYPWAQSIIAVSQGIAQELRQTLGEPARSDVQVIYNPVMDGALVAQAEVPLSHPWLAAGQSPVFLAVGRLAKQKDYPTLLAAFRQLRQTRAAKLIILGEGELRSQLERMITQWDLTTDVELHGFVKNPYAYMQQATALVLSSLWETFGMVLAEALACGCPVISTDCEYGPREILANGKYGALVPVGQVDKLAIAMEQVLTDDCDRAALIARGQEFTAAKAAMQYLQVLDASVQPSTADNA